MRSLAFGLDGDLPVEHRLPGSVHEPHGALPHLVAERAPRARIGLVTAALEQPDAANFGDLAPAPAALRSIGDSTLSLNGDFGPNGTHTDVRLIDTAGIYTLPTG